LFRAKYLKFNEFPQDNHLWKIDWVGEALLNPSTRAKPTIKLFLSRVITDNLIDTLSQSKLHSYCEIRVGVGHLNLFNIGSVWENGIKKADALDTRLFVSKVNTATAHVVPFREVIHNSFPPILSKLNYPVGKQTLYSMQESPLIAFSYNNDPTGILIPAIEVVRFYYLISSRLSFATFFGEISALTKETPTFDLDKKTVSMSLEWGLTHNDAWILGRYWSSEVMMKGAKEFRDWIKKNSINNKDNISSSTFLPFEGTTELVFNGVEVSCADGVTRYLCTKIRQCSGPINYEKIILNKVIKALGDEENDAYQALITSNWPLYENENTDVIESQETASGENLPKDYSEEEIRFGALKDKTLIVNTTNVFGETKSEKYIGAGGRDIFLTSGEGSGGRKDLRQATVSTNLQRVESEFSEGPERLKAFLRILAELRGIDGLEVETLGLYRPKDSEDNKLYKPVKTYEVANETVIGCFQATTKRNAWINKDNGSPRGLIIAEVKWDQKYWYILEMEKLESELNDTYSLLILYFPDNSKIYNKNLYEYVSACCEHKGWMPLKGKFSKYRKYNFAHTLNLKKRILEIVTS